MIDTIVNLCYAFVCYLEQASAVAPAPQSVTLAPSIACRLLKSLASLFALPFLCFQQLAASLCKIPGVGYTPPRTKRCAWVQKNIDFLLLSFHIVMNCSFRKCFVLIT